MFALVCNQCQRVSQIPELDGYFELVTGPQGARSIWHFCGWGCLKAWTAAVALTEGAAADQGAADATEG